MSKIFIPNKGVHDYSNAERFGELVFMSTGKFRLLSIGRMFRTFEPFLKGSKPNDYILIAGSTVMNSIACSMFTKIHGKLNLLIFTLNRHGDGEYKKRNLILDDLTTL